MSAAKKTLTGSLKDKQNPERRNDNSNEVISSKTFFATLDLPFTIIIKKQFSFVSTATPV